MLLMDGNGNGIHLTDRFDRFPDGITAFLRVDGLLSN